MDLVVEYVDGDLTRLETRRDRFNNEGAFSSVFVSSRLLEVDMRRMVATRSFELTRDDNDRQSRECTVRHGIYLVLVV